MLPASISAMAFLNINITHKNGAFLKIKDELTLTYHNHLKSMVYQPKYTLGCTLGVVYSMGLDKCIKPCIHHYSIIQSIFSALKFLCALPAHLTPCRSQGHWQH